MSERWAMRLVYAASAVLTTVAVLGLWLLRAPVEVIGLAWTLVLIGTGTAAGYVTVRYPTSNHDDE